MLTPCHGGSEFGLPSLDDLSFDIFIFFLYKAFSRQNICESEAELPPPFDRIGKIGPKCIESHEFELREFCFDLEARVCLFNEYFFPGGPQAV